jgi:hypothetical protein
MIEINSLTRILTYLNFAIWRGVLRGFFESRSLFQEAHSGCGGTGHGATKSRDHPESKQIPLGEAAPVQKMPGPLFKMGRAVAFDLMSFVLLSSVGLSFCEGRGNGRESTLRPSDV